MSKPSSITPALQRKLRLEWTWQGLRRTGLLLGLLCGLILMLPEWAAAQAPEPPPPVKAEAGSQSARPPMIILAVRDRGDALPGAGGSPRADYRRMAGYAGGAQAQALADALAQEYHLAPRAAWTIAPLNLRCMLFALAPDADAAALLQRLQADSRVQLAQPLQEFETLSSPSATYNDPYYQLQTSFQQLDAAALQQLSTGARVKIALIDTGVDASHPDLQGQIERQRDYVSGGGALGRSAPERHGTEVAGLIAARANNHQGIVGLAPGVQLMSYRACWSVAEGERGGSARCNSFTLAQALGAAIADGADIINLSLGGPSDPLLSKLAGHAMARGALMVAAAPPARLGRGFPSELPGVLVVANSGELPSGSDWLAAPGRAVLSTVPGGRYDMDSGSSLAAAQASGVLALLRSAAPQVSGSHLTQALRRSMSPDKGINACLAAQALGLSPLRCEGVAP